MYYCIVALCILWLGFNPYIYSQSNKTKRQKYNELLACFGVMSIFDIAILVGIHYQVFDMLII